MLELMGIIDIVARSGGGGSSSGGGSGGEAIALLGYFPSYYLGKLIKKLLPRKAELIVSAAFATVFSIILLAIGLFGGFNGVLFTVLVVIGIWSGWAAAFFSVWDKLHKKASKAKATITQAAGTDAVWNETQLMAYAQQTFMQYQYDWSAFNLDSMQRYLSPRYAQHSNLLMSALKELGRSNIMANVQIKQSLIIDAHDDINNDQDSFDVAFEASALDQLVDQTGAVIFKDTKPFTEYWHFIRSGNTWLLDGIIQQTQELSLANQSLCDFAQKNSMFYSLDMGWLLLPSRGLLMARGKMGVSDINNHVIGTYSGRLVQLYTYTPLPSQQGSFSWLVLQVTLPKSYGGIIVQRDQSFFSAGTTYQKPTKEYKKYEFEWPDFNKRYDVHATDADRLAAFELINPGFMAYLYDNDPQVGIEVVDSTLYLFRYLGTRTTTNVKPEDYNTMLTIALKAFKELQL